MDLQTFYFLSGILFLAILVVVGQRYKNTAYFLFVGGVILAASLVAVSEIREYREQQRLGREEASVAPAPAKPDVLALCPHSTLGVRPPQFISGARGAAAPAAVANPYARMDAKREHFIPR
jgi:hypothetical protein